MEQSCDGGSFDSGTSGRTSNSKDWPEDTAVGYQDPMTHFFVGDMEEYLDDQESTEKKVTVGICAMAKKSNSKPMKEIVKRLENFSRLQIVIFEEDVILDHPVEEWPVVNAFISFFSSGFPLDKAIAYKNLRQPFVVNNLEMQYILQDRTEVYRLLSEHGIPHPRYTVLNKERETDCVVVETEDSIEINGKLHTKPFVEKPISAEDHNVYIYFPQAAGGGSTRLFRKVKDRSSVYSRTSRVRRNGAFVYEDFMPTDGTDVKIYTVGMDYQHAEARKSPALDGKVERDEDGKEIRYPVLLSAREKLIARKVCKAFKQNVCGFDLLRANGKCFVCDVNGFSFVKTSNKYYDDCARILGTLILREVCPTLHIPYPVGPAPEDIPVVPTTSGPMMELRCVVALIRHGDRTPKQKMKMEVKNKLFFELFEKYGGFKSGNLKLKRPKQLQEVLDIVRQLLADGTITSDPDLQDKKAKLQQMKLVLEMYGHFSGINRKVQLKYQPQGRPKRSSSEDDFDLYDMYEFTGIHRKVQLKFQPQGRPHTSSSDEDASTPLGSAEEVELYPGPSGVHGHGLWDDAPRDPSLLLILKWGGELTPAGRIQAENLGKAFRTLYPGGQGQFEAPGLGFLRLHSTFRHDLKIYASDEGRVQMTAAAFTKGLLALEGELAPILVQMVKSANTNGLLDADGKTSKCQIVVKEKLKDVFNQKRDFNEEDYFKLNPINTLALTNAMDFVKNPLAMCERVYQMIREITSKIRTLKAELKTRDLTLYNGESWELLIRRWAKLEKDFQLKSGKFEVSKIPDIYDCIKYDLQHNQSTLNFERAQELFMCSKALADIIIPQEYGITTEEKLHIAQNYCLPILRKIRSDFLQVSNLAMDDDATRLDSRYSKGVSSPERFVRTRLYFTSESHIHSVLNILRHGYLFEPGSDSQWDRAMSFLDATAELNYMSQIVIMLFEDPSKGLSSDERYHMELHFSPGAHTSCDEPSEPRGMGYRPKNNSTSRQVTSDNDNCKTPSLLVSAFAGPLPSSKHSMRMDMAATSDLGDINESELFDLALTPSSSLPSSPRSQDTPTKSQVSTPTQKATSFIPGSPDPTIPEWDWGDENEHTSTTSASAQPEITFQAGNIEASRDESRTSSERKDMNNEEREMLVERLSSSAEDMKTNHQDSDVKRPVLPSSPPMLISRQHSTSQPIDINIISPSSTSTADTSKLSFDEKRSRSLEEKNGASADNAIQRHYKTVHLPLRTDVGLRCSLPSLFSLGLSLTGVRVPNYRSFKMRHNSDSALAACRSEMKALDVRRTRGKDDLILPGLMCSSSTPDFKSLTEEQTAALEGFNYVPLLHPLETLHNNLTFREMDDFLGRITTTRFPMPPISPTLVASHPSLILVSPGKSVQSYPPSSNSSSAPSSPALSIPLDIWQNLRMYMERSDGQVRSDPDTDSSTSSGRREVPAPPNSNSSVAKTEAVQECSCRVTYDPLLETSKELSQNEVDLAVTKSSHKRSAGLEEHLQVNCESEQITKEMREEDLNKNNSSAWRSEAKEFMCHKLDKQDSMLDSTSVCIQEPKVQGARHFEVINAEAKGQDLNRNPTCISGASVVLCQEAKARNLTASGQRSSSERLLPGPVSTTVSTLTTTTLTIHSTAPMTLTVQSQAPITLCINSAGSVCISGLAPTEPTPAPTPTSSRFAVSRAVELDVITKPSVEGKAALSVARTDK